ncbi:multidrug transporter subunit MdtN [[Enterobacter] lignolyticus]|uniref:Secretion protein HlyD family protein n=1 Tax=Enterobacter lignolyticus (strain SCF1) TaxID=701347 RepID=E3G8X8_ENTLS|nr:multidrug transporter subunit MdtN [[Enterobacter] lignolyticus]ADO48699.1 secretion protein HlyD family protein [[Enterobacter] lignolyticus SCF1]
MPLKKKIYIAGLLAVTLLVLAIVLVKIDRAPGTDDAYVYADTINVVPEVSGRIIALPVQDNQLVRKGDLLFRIDPRPFQNALNAGTARLATLNEQIKLTQRSVNAQQYNADAVTAQVESARVQFQQAKDTWERKRALIGKNYVSKEELDQAKTVKDSAEANYNAARLQARQATAAVSGVDALVAQREEVKAQIAEAQLNLEYSEVRAPFDGRVASLKTTVGQYASPAQSIMTLIDIRQWYVIANFRETDLNGISAGSRAEVFIMGNTREPFSGTVDSVSYGVATGDSAAPGGLPFVEKTINWVHVSQRFPTKIRITSPDPSLFRIGASAVVTVYRDAPASRSHDER